MNIQQGPPMFNMTHVLPGPSVSEALPINTQQLPTLPTQQRPQPFCDNNTLQMILENINHMNSRLAKLDMLDDLCSRMASIESHFNIVKTEIKDIRYDMKQQSERITNEEFHYNIVETRVSGLEAENDKLQYENIELKEKLLEMQAHSMKYNLIFSGIKESSQRQNEKVEDTIKEFIANELNINSETIQFQNVHRLKQRGDGKPRNIIAKFVKYSDHEMIRSAAYKHLKGKKDVAVFQQYPAEISNRRKELIPRMIALKREGRQNVRMVLDKLYVGNQLYNDHEAPYPPSSRQDAYTHGPQPGFVPGREKFLPRGPPPGHHAGPGFQSGST
ncbi:unnamed protein product [Mytilus coruscus]|uniref:Uncharacterized protein n=1 Tax=Mytilus coruscus TaxID=42192 RepID=A0A6J8DEN0_MYTCO|nr:unnamed protein product [Mytilus coruscus]